jgi:hypothetical protein
VVVTGTTPGNQRRVATSLAQQYWDAARAEFKFGWRTPPIIQPVAAMAIKPRFWHLYCATNRTQNFVRLAAVAVDEIVEHLRAGNHLRDSVPASEPFRSPRGAETSSRYGFPSIHPP